MCCSSYEIFKAIAWIERKNHSSLAVRFLAILSTVKPLRINAFYFVLNNMATFNIFGVKLIETCAESTTPNTWMRERRLSESVIQSEEIKSDDFTNVRLYLDRIKL